MLKTELRLYQVEAVVKARAHDGFLLLAEQRCGKTLTALAIVNERKPAMLLILCPVNAIPVWHKQLAEHLQIDWEMEIQVVNLEFLSHNMKRRRQFYKWADQWKGESFMVICDEVHKVKKRGSTQSRALRVLAKRARWRLGLTGTPIDDTLDQAWAVMNFVNPEVFGSFEEFAFRFLKMGGFKGKKVVGARNLGEFKRILHQHMHRITLREARETPLRIRRVRVPVKLSDASRHVYDRLRDHMRAEIGGVQLKVKLAITQAAKLQQITSGFAIVGEQGFKQGRVHRVGLDKAEAVLKLLGTEIGHQKCVIVCKFTEDMDLLEAAVKEFWPVKRIDGKHPFDGKFDTDIVLLQIKCGNAFDLSAADHMIFFSMNHSHLDHAQAASRILNYTKPQVSYYYLIAEDTVDEPLHAAAFRKAKFSTALLDHYRRRNRP